MKDLLMLCTKNVHFTFNDITFLQIDGVAMGSPLGPVLAGIFMTQLERTILPELGSYMLPWSRYVDDTVTAVNSNYVNQALTALNGFDNNIQFTYELESNNNCLPFLDVLLVRKQQLIETQVYRKPTANNIYLHWESHAPKSWKIGTLKTLLLRAYKICSSTKSREEELKHISTVFNTINGYPVQVIENVMEKMQEGIISDSTSKDNSPQSILTLPYKGQQGNRLLKSLVRTLEQQLNTSLQVRYTGTKLAKMFNIKDKTKIDHLYDVVYMAKCPEITCKAVYIGETGRRLKTRIDEHNGKDNKSNVAKHMVESGHGQIKDSDFNILAKNTGGTYSRKIIEALYIKKLKPSLNVQHASVPLSLF